MRYVVDTSYLHVFYEVIVREAVTATGLYVHWFVHTLHIPTHCNIII